MTEQDMIVWVDCEMTGLDRTKDKIIEIAVIITDQDLNVVAEMDSITINQSDELLDNMNEWCIKHHGESGLTKRVKESKTSTKEAEDKILKFVKKHVKKERTAPLAGNTVYADRQFLEREMPTFNEYLHYRIIDVSCFKEVAKRWYPTEFAAAPPKTYKHLALDDIRESIKELQYYRASIFK
ncbi:oligoribonuclease [Acrasis kona]|uniref:Oligoribonuclease n=1 Tax=Acrasis kona TaxID=1008807 RepID=A0AAW2ZPH8_9EUKA